MKTSGRSLQDVLKMSWRHLEDVFKTSWRSLENVLKTYGQDEYIGVDQDVLKTSSEDLRLRGTYSSWSRRLEDVFWRRRQKTSSRRLHQDECFLGSYSIPSHVTLNNSIKANKIKHLRGQISLVHCRGHDFIMLFYFDGFYDNHRQLLSKMFYFR